MKNKSEKYLKWEKKDVYLNVLTYFINFLVLCGVLLLEFFIEDKRGVLDSKDFFNDIPKLINVLSLILLAVCIQFTYLYFRAKDFLKSASNSEMLFLIIELSLLTSFLVGLYNLFLRPIFVVMLITIFLTTRRISFFDYMLYCILQFIFDVVINSVTNEFASIVLVNNFISTIASGFIALFILDKTYTRISMFIKSLLASIPCVLSAIILYFEFGNDLGNVYLNVLFAVISAPFSVALFMVHLPFFEMGFKSISSFSFAELTDHKSKLIRRLIEEAPGTFNHAIVVSNIAEACATAIGEDALLARTCAYYHDVGKLRRPEFFKENQAEGVDPHADLTPELSTNIIKAHAIDGYKLVIKNGLPKTIADVCLEHHGTMPILYFYDKAKKFTDGEVDIKKFCYMGPKPQSKISAIVMIADGCEAAARALKDRSRENVKNMVQKIIDDRLKLGQFDECEITIKELNIISHTIVNNLTGIYHNRIEYPKVKIEELEKDEGEM